MRQRGLPRQASPLRLEEQLGAHWENVVSSMTDPYYPLLELNPRARLDSGKSAQAKHLLDKAKNAVERKLGEARSRVEGLASVYGQQVSSFQRHQLNRQTETALGINLLGMRDADIGRHLHRFIHDNVGLITSISSDQHDAVEQTVMDAVHGGTHHEALQHALHRRFGISTRHARLIARDQTTKLYSRVNRTRQQHLGIHRYIWTSMNDERVRDSHDDMDGVVCRHDDPPIVDGVAAHPGDPVCCRCFADPLFSDLLP